MKIFGLRAALFVSSIAFACGWAPQAGAQGTKASSPVEFVRMTERLKPGEWVWAPAAAPEGQVLVYVDLSRQLATVYRNGIRIGVSTISSGKRGYETPTGVFTILQKDANHRSSTYNNAPMPFQQRLTWDGVALHAGGVRGHPESHGCVHLPYGFSQSLFAITSLGVTVVVEGSAVDHVHTSAASLLSPFDRQGRRKPGAMLGVQQFVWMPERSPAGPTTIIVSKADQRMVVLRGGIEIGRSVVEVSRDDQNSHVVTLSRRPDGSPQWVYVGLPGHEAEGGRGISEADINRLRLPRRFYATLLEILRPGATILVTSSSVGVSSGEPTTVMDAVVPQL